MTMAMVSVAMAVAVGDGPMLASVMTVVVVARNHAESSACKT